MTDVFLPLKTSPQTEEQADQLEIIVKMLVIILEKNEISVELGLMALKELLCRVLCTAEEIEHIHSYILSIERRVFNLRQHICEDDTFHSNIDSYE